MNRSQSHTSRYLECKSIYKKNHDLDQEGCDIKRVKKAPQKVYQPLNQQSYTIFENDDPTKNYHLGKCWYNSSGIKTDATLQQMYKDENTNYTKNPTPNKLFRIHRRSKSTIPKTAADNSKARMLETKKEIRRSRFNIFLKRFDNSLSKYYKRIKLKKNESSQGWESPFMSYKSCQKHQRSYLGKNKSKNIERTQEKIDNNNSIAPGYIQRRNFSRFKERICRPYYKGGRINIPVLQKQIEASIKDNSLKLADLNSIQSPNPKFFNEKIDEANSISRLYQIRPCIWPGKDVY
ncbi:unnamed protein product [Moneuplotes crassus]|uniref:Uncharacterized protein n=1 Tax=Euplotes crassus TaxID=5936 RepID=A0AAD1UL88_EUPCR|nr:unnamed protein product [Moneuplotes crassus]